MRILTDEERGAILQLSQEIGSDKEREQLLKDLDSCTVKDLTTDGSLLRFNLSGYERPPNGGQHAFRGKDRFPVEGTVKDTDGEVIEVYIFADENNRLLEFELNKWVGDVINPDWSTFKVR